MDSAHGFSISFRTLMVGAYIFNEILQFEELKHCPFAKVMKV